MLGAKAAISLGDGPVAGNQADIERGRLASEPPSQVLEFVVGDAWIGGQQRFDALQGRRSLLDFAGHGRVRHGQLTSTMTRNASTGNARIAPITA